MEKLVQHGKIWIIASVVSIFSFMYLQLDSQNLADRQAEELMGQMEVSKTMDEEVKMIDWDIIKGLSMFLVDVVKLGK